MKKRPAAHATSIAYLSEFMRGLREDQTRLNEIQTVYDNLTLLGQLLCAGTDITRMRDDFKSLADVLLTELAHELRKKASLDLRSSARVAIDILVRNLFERTADIGFLATDSEVRSYAELAGRHDVEPATVAGQRATLQARFDEYVRKYSVYHDIILLAPDGRVLARLDASNTATASPDPLVAQSITTDAAYVETFRATDLLPREAAPLIYSYRVTSEDGSRVLGVLCLCFRLEDECRRIFDGLLGKDDWRVITLLAPDGRVIASSDPYQFPAGARLERADGEECRIVRFAGREYLATTCASHGYQGYAGPGWLGHALAPLNHAFEMAPAGELEGVARELREGVLDTTTLFAPELRDIPLRAASIQRELNRAVWNGNVWLSRDRGAFNTAFAKVLLWEIGSTGMKTRSVFSDSTTNLYETVVSSVLADCSAKAALAIDIMDRNLYERANDCRWWALTGAFRTALASGSPARDALTGILRTINGLYTVYANLLVFDAAGQVLAVSNPGYQDMVGQPLGAEWVRRTLALPDSQHYCVSAFAPTPLYGGLPTYVYSAAIRAPGDAGETVGGIAIVFDAAPQFVAMLEDALPRQEDGRIIDGAFAVFAERDGRIVASTDPRRPAGTQLSLDRAFLAIGRGERHLDIVELDGRYYAVGAHMSAGYREYKGEGDSYRNDIAALVFVPLSDRVLRPDERPALNTPAHSVAYGQRQTGGEDAVEVATFHIGDSWYGIRSSCVVEAIDAARITTVPGMPEWVHGCIMHNGQPITLIDMARLLHRSPTVPRAAQQIVVVQVAERGVRFGLLVDALGSIPEIAAHRIEPVPTMLAHGNTMAESLVKPHPDDPEHRILIILSPERVLLRLSGMLPDDAAPLLLPPASESRVLLEPAMEVA